MRKNIFLILMLALVTVFSALFFTGCGNKPSGGGDSEIERPEEDNNGGDTGKDDKNNSGNNEGKSEDGEKPDYLDPNEDGGWTDWQK